MIGNSSGRELIAVRKQIEAGQEAASGWLRSFPLRLWVRQAVIRVSAGKAVVRIIVPMGEKIHVLISLDLLWVNGLIYLVNYHSRREWLWCSR